MRPLLLPAGARFVAPFHRLPPPHALALDEALHSPADAHVRHHRDELLESCLVLEDTGPREWHAGFVEVMADASEGVDQRLKRVDAIPGLADPDPRTGDVERAFPVVVALRLARS